MKKKKKIFNILVVVLVLVISMECIAYADDAVIKSQGKIVFDNNTAETADDVIFDASDLTTLDTMVKTGKANISSAINEYPHVEVEALDTFDNLTDAISSLTAVPDIYYYDKATEGDNCARYMYENGSYYPCDQNGVKTSDTALSGTITVVTKDDTTEASEGEIQLVKYTQTDAANLSAGYAGYVDKSFILGSGSDNISYRNQSSISKITIKYKVIFSAAPADTTPINKISNYTKVYEKQGDTWVCTSTTGKQISYYDNDNATYYASATIESVIVE